MHTPTLKLKAKASAEIEAEPYLWRAVDQHSVVLDVPVQRRRDGKAAKRFFKRLLKGSQYVPHVPRVIVTD
jgi:putative transposase